MWYPIGSRVEMPSTRLWAMEEVTARREQVVERWERWGAEQRMHCRERRKRWCDNRDRCEWGLRSMVDHVVVQGDQRDGAPQPECKQIQTQPVSCCQAQDHPSSGQWRRPEMRNCPFSRLDLLEGPRCPIMTYLHINIHIRICVCVSKVDKTILSNTKQIV